MTTSWLAPLPVFKALSVALVLAYAFALGFLFGAVSS